jgi:hypothetical protein
MRAIRILTGVLLWLGGIAVIASLSWVAINSAGRQVVDQVVAGDQQDTRTPSGGVASSGLAEGMSTTSSRGAATGGRTPSGVNSTGWPDTGTPAETPEPSATEGGSSDAQLPPTAVPVQGSMPTAGGGIWAECTGAVITDYLVQPNAGWQARYDWYGAGDLEASFIRSGATIEVRVTCGGGKPEFVASTATSDNDD